MEKIPTISVIMSVYKEPLDWLRQSIDSILRQTYTDFEFIIICDNPHYSEGITLLNMYARQDERIKLIFNDENIGLTKSLNKGVHISRGEFIARMDADDISLNNRFIKQIEILINNPDIDVCGTNAKYFGSKKGIISCPQYDNQFFLFLDNCFVHSSVMMRKRIASLGYNEKCVAAQDYELWFRARNNGATFYNIQEALVLYRCNSSQISNTKKDIQGSVARKVRRLSLNMLLENQQIHSRLYEEPVSLEFVECIFKDLKLHGEYKRKLIYYLLLSTKCPFFDLFFFLLRTKIIFYMHTNRVFKLLMRNMTNSYVFKF